MKDDEAVPIKSENSLHLFSVIVFVIALLICFMVMHQLPSYQNCCNQYYKQYQAQNDKKDLPRIYIFLGNATCTVRFMDRHNGAVVAAATVLIMFFTFLLWWSTHRLWMASEKQSTDMKDSIAQAVRSADAAETAAVAARRSADVLPTTERAYVFVVSVRNLGPTGKGIKINLTIKNEGRTPGLITDVRLDLVSVTECPKDVPDKSCGAFVETGNAIGVGQPQNYPYDLGYQRWFALGRPITGNPLIDMESRQTICYGCVQYEDIFKAAHYVRFCWHQDQETTGGEFYRCKNRECNQEYDGPIP